MMETRFDYLESELTGRGGNKDKLTELKPKQRELDKQELLQWYETNGLAQNIIDAPAEDATREWFEIKTNEINKNISRMIQNRLTELDIQNKIKELIRQSRILPNGAILYYSIISDGQLDKTKSIGRVLEINAINVVTDFTLGNLNTNIDSKEYNKPQILYYGNTLHIDRYSWMVRKFIPELKRGISVIKTILDGLVGMDTALWAVTNLLNEMDAKIMKSDIFRTEDPQKYMELLSKIRMAWSVQSTFGITQEEEMQRLAVPSLHGLKDTFDFVFQNLAAMAQQPESKIKGQAQGQITAGQFDIVSYYEKVSQYQENEIKPVLEKIIGLIIREERREIYKALNGKIETLDWEIKFNPLWKLTEKEESENELKNAQTDQIYITTGVLAPEEVRQERFKELEEMETVSEKIDFTVPELPKEETDKNAI